MTLSVCILHCHAAIPICICFFSTRLSGPIVEDLPAKSYYLIFPRCTTSANVRHSFCCVSTDLSAWSCDQIVINGWCCQCALASLSFTDSSSSLQLHKNKHEAGFTAHFGYPEQVVVLSSSIRSSRMRNSGHLRPDSPHIWAPSPRAPTTLIDHSLLPQSIPRCISALTCTLSALHISVTWKDFCGW